MDGGGEQETAGWAYAGSFELNYRLLRAVITGWSESYCAICIRGACGSGKSYLVSTVLASLNEPTAAYKIHSLQLSAYDIYRHEFPNGGTALLRCVAEARISAMRKKCDVVVIVMEHAELFLTLDCHQDGRKTFTHAGFVMDLISLQEDLLVFGEMDSTVDGQRVVFVLECTERSGLSSDGSNESSSLSGILHLDAGEVTSLFDVSITVSAPVEEERMKFFASNLEMLSLPWRRELASKTGGILPQGLREISEICREMLNPSPSNSLCGPPPSVDAVIARYISSGTHSCMMSRSSAGFADIQQTKWTDIVGLEDVKSQLIELLNAQVKNFAVFRHHQVHPRAGVLLYGPPGTGKTMLARAMATELHASFIYLDLPQLIHAEVGESERVLEEFFEAACLRSPCVMFIDEIQAAFGLRNSSSNSSHDSRLVSFLLQKLDDARRDEEHTILFVGATNVVHLLDPALLLPGRLDVQICVPPPDGSTRREQVRLVLTQQWMSWQIPQKCADILITRFADMLDGATGAEISNCLNLFGLGVLAAINVNEGDSDWPVEKIGGLLWDSETDSLSNLARGALDECRSRLKRRQ